MRWIRRRSWACSWNNATTDSRGWCPFETTCSTRTWLGAETFRREGNALGEGPRPEIAGSREVRGYMVPCPHTTAAFAAALSYPRQGRVCSVTLVPMPFRVAGRCSMRLLHVFSQLLPPLWEMPGWWMCSGDTTLRIRRHFGPRGTTQTALKQCNICKYPLLSLQKACLKVLRAWTGAVGVTVCRTRHESSFVIWITPGLTKPAIPSTEWCSLGQNTVSTIEWPPPVSLKPNPRSNWPHEIPQNWGVRYPEKRLARLDLRRPTGIAP